MRHLISSTCLGKPHNTQEFIAAWDVVRKLLVSKVGNYLHKTIISITNHKGKFNGGLLFMQTMPLNLNPLELIFST